VTRAAAIVVERVDQLPAETRERLHQVTEEAVNDG
jgi:hypothetical protein